jgi:hypothetical protein
VTAAAAVVQLDRARAEQLTAKLRDALDVAVGIVRELHEREGWRAMGYPSWPAYCRAELPQLAVIVRGMPKDERRATVAELRGSGISLRDVAELTGLAPNTVRADAAAAGVRLELVRGRDGALRSATAAPAPVRRRTPTTDRLVALLAAAGPGGMTVRDVVSASRLPRVEVSPALCRLAAAGRVTYRAPERRGQFGSYVAGAVPGA